MAVQPQQARMVFDRLYSFIDTDGFLKYYGITKPQARKIMGITSAGQVQQVSRDVTPGLNLLEKGFKKTSLSRLFQIWARQVQSKEGEPSKWSEEVVAILSPTLTSLIMLSLYVQKYGTKVLQDQGFMDAVKSIDTNLAYTYKMTVTKIGNLDPASASTVNAKIAANVYSRKNTFRNYLNSLIAFGEDNNLMG